MKSNNEIIKLAKRYIKSNTGNKNPYHNNKHMLFVYDMSLKIFDDEISRNKISELEIESGKLLLGLASLFHDYDHSGGKETDFENIQRAINGFNDFVYFNLDNDLFPYRYPAIVSIIKATEFPHKQVSEKAILIHIIRDADTIGGIYDGWENVVRNICKEMNKSIESFLPIQIKFITNISFKTDFAKKICEERRRDVLEKLIQLKD